MAARETILDLAIFDRQVTLILPNKFRVKSPLRSGKKFKTDIHYENMPIEIY